MAMATGLITCLARVESRGAYESAIFHINHGEEHSYQGVLLRHDLVRYRLFAINAPLPSDSLHLVLEFDISEWTDVADPRLEAQYEKVSAEFKALCSEIESGDVLEITYSETIRAAALSKRPTSDPRSVPWVHYPYGLETYTSSYSREGRSDYPDVERLVVLRREPQTDTGSPWLDTNHMKERIS